VTVIAVLFACLVGVDVQGRAGLSGALPIKTLSEKLLEKATSGYTPALVYQISARLGQTSETLTAAKAMCEFVLSAISLVSPVEGRTEKSCSHLRIFPYLPWVVAATNGMPLLTHRVIPITTEEYPTPARRPAYSVLSTAHLYKSFGIRVPSWRKQLQSMFTPNALRDRLVP
jgi:dTDP-4-dehydrorhamnose reductase